MRKTGYLIHLISIVGLLLLFTVKIGPVYRSRQRRRVQRLWDHKRVEWLQKLSA
jgi:uncharacterized Tic20 family protein